jgi:hypothetical protein
LPLKQGNPKSKNISSTFYNHWHTVSGKPHLLGGVKIGDGLHQADAAHLKQIIGALSPFFKPLDNAEHQTQITFDQLLTGGNVTVVGFYQQCIHLQRGQGGQPCGVYTADLYFSQHGIPPAKVGNPIISRRAGMIPGSVLCNFHKNICPVLPGSGSVYFMLSVFPNFFAIFRPLVTQFFAVT